MVKKIAALVLGLVVMLSCTACSSASQDPFVAEFSRKTKQQFETFQKEPDSEDIWALRKGDARVDILCGYKGGVKLKSLDSVSVHVDKSLGNEALKSYFRIALEILGIPETEIKKALENDSDFPEKVTSSLNGLTYLASCDVTDDRYDSNNFIISLYDN